MLPDGPAPQQQHPGSSSSNDTRFLEKLPVAPTVMTLLIRSSKEELFQNVVADLYELQACCRAFVFEFEFAFVLAFVLGIALQAWSLNTLLLTQLWCRCCVMLCCRGAFPVCSWPLRSHLVQKQLMNARIDSQTMMTIANSGQPTWTGIHHHLASIPLVPSPGNCTQTYSTLL